MNLPPLASIYWQIKSNWLYVSYRGRLSLNVCPLVRDIAKRPPVFVLSLPFNLCESIQVIPLAPIAPPTAHLTTTQADSNLS
jgi:hypothetical protein